MATRDGMQNLIKRVRGMAQADTSEYTIYGETYWTDEHIQSILDSNAQFLVDSPLTWRKQTIGGGTVNYLVAESLYRDFEEAVSGTAQWIVRDSAGAEIGTANYSVDYRAGRLTFTSDQGGTAYYLTAYTYDVNAATADVWGQRLANFTDWYDFSADNQDFSRSQVFEHAQEMEQHHRRQAGQNLVSNAGGDVRTAEFVRVDVA